jgi:DNA-binding transcriptional LysR family regulator
MPLDVRRLHMLRELSGAAPSPPPRGRSALAARDLPAPPPRSSAGSVSLLERQGRRVRLTPAAHLLVRRTERVLAELEAAEAELAASQTEVRGVVRLAAFPTAAATLVPRAMAAFASRHSHAEVTLAELEPEAALPALKLGEVDVAIVHEYDFRTRGDDGESG